MKDNYVIITPTLKIAHYGEERDLDCSDGEIQIANLIVEAFPNENLRLVRVSDEYVTIRREEWDIARFKYRPRAKWIFFPIREMKKDRHVINTPEDVTEFVDLIAESIGHAERYK